MTLPGRSISARAGLRPGDVIVELAGQVVQGEGDVHRVMASVRAGQTVGLVLWRDGQKIRATVRF